MQYFLVVLLDGLVVVLKPILNPRAQRRREHEAALVAEEESNVGVAKTTEIKPDDSPEPETEATTIGDEKASKTTTGCPLGLGQGEDGRTLTTASDATATSEPAKQKQ